MSMTFPLIYFLYAFYAFLAVWAVFCCVVVFHLATYGFKNFTTFLSIFIFIAFSVLLLLACFDFIDKIQWQTSITLFEGIVFTPTTY